MPLAMYPIVLFEICSQEAFSNMQKLNMTYFDTTPAGAIVSRLTNDTQAVSDMFSSIFSYVLSYLIYRRSNIICDV